MINTFLTIIKLIKVVICINIFKVIKKIIITKYFNLSFLPFVLYFISTFSEKVMIRKIPFLHVILAIA